MKKLFHFMAVMSLSVAGLAASAALPVTQAEAQTWRGDGPRYDRDRRDDRRDYRRDGRRDWREDRRDWRGNRRDWRDDRGRNGDWRGRREERVAREYDRARRTPGYVDPRSQGDNTNYTGRGSGYRPCTYVERNGRTVCR